MYKKLIVCTAFVLLGGILSLAVKLPAKPAVAYASEERQALEGNDWPMWEFCQQMMQSFQGTNEDGNQEIMLTGGSSDEMKEFVNEWSVEDRECYDWPREQSRKETRMNCH